jgi:hypothetical protein
MPRLKNAIHEKFAQLLSLKPMSQHAAWLEAIGPQRAAKVLAKNKRATSLTSAASKLAAKPSIRARVEEIRAQNEQECRWNRKQLLDFYCDVLEVGAGDLRPSDRLCQGIEETTTTTYDGKGRPRSKIKRKRLIMPSKVEAADGIRKMLGWDKVVKAGEPEDDITELLVMIRRRSGHGQLESGKPAEVKPAGHALLEAKPAELKVLSQKPEATQVLERLSRGHFEPLPLMVSPSGTE